MSTANHMQQVNVNVSSVGGGKGGHKLQQQQQQNGGGGAGGGSSTGSTPPGPLTNGPNMAPQQPPPSQSASPPVNNAPKYGMYLYSLIPLVKLWNPDLGLSSNTQVQTRSGFKLDPDSGSIWVQA